MLSTSGSDPATFIPVFIRLVLSASVIKAAPLLIISTLLAIFYQSPFAMIPGMLSQSKLSMAFFSSPTR